MGRGIQAFFEGVCLAMILEISDKKVKINLKYLSAGLLILTLVLYVLRKYIYIHFGKNIDVLGNCKPVLTFIVFPCVIYLSLMSRHINKVLSFTPLVYFGQYSYAIYLLNLPIYYLEHYMIGIFHLDINYSSIGAFLILNIVLLIIAIVLHHLYEKPLIRWLKIKFKI